jgi:hypothetical protein
MRFDQYENESRIYLDCLKEALSKQEEDMLTVFIQQGPEVLRKKLNLVKDSDWMLVFDHLVFSGEVLKKCVVNFMPFFKHMVITHGPAVLRKIFDIDGKKYDPVFEQLFDLVAVSHGALYDYVYNNREMFAKRITAGRTKSLRHELCLGGAKYDSLWEEVLGLLCEAVCTAADSDRAYESGLLAFSMMMNGLREQRSLRSFAKMWEYSEKKQ